MLAARLLGATVASFVGLTEVLFAVLIAWVVLGQDLSAPQLAGGGLVVVGIALVQGDDVRRQRRARRAVATAAGEGRAADAEVPELVATS